MFSWLRVAAVVSPKPATDNSIPFGLFVRAIVRAFIASDLGGEPCYAMVYLTQAESVCHLLFTYKAGFVCIGANSIRQGNWLW